MPQVRQRARPIVRARSRPRERAPQQGTQRLTPYEWGAFYSPTCRQRQVVAGMSLGWTDRKIADELGVTANTVRTIIKQIRRYVGPTTRHSLVARFIREGWID
jgi:DNA-binding NarL/FixJ family response regulator